MSQPPYPPQPSYPQQPPTGQLVINLRKPAGWLSASMMTPQVRIDGHPAPVRWERNAFPVLPGPHQVEASTTYMWEFGRASLPVQVAPHTSVEVFYSSPMITFIGGRMGFQPQPRPGAVAVLAIAGVALAILVLAIVVAVAGSAGG